MPGSLGIRQIDAEEAGVRIAELSAVLTDCVDGGASVGFMAPLLRESADCFWSGVRDRMAAHACQLLIAERDGEIIGTVQLLPAQPENQPHRADVAKMLVRRNARRQGAGRALMTAIEALAIALGKTLLVLDTVTGGDGERLYQGLGWTRVGGVPSYALFPDGRPCDTTFFYKALAPPPARIAGGPEGAPG